MKKEAKDGKRTERMEKLLQKWNNVENMWKYK